METSDTKLERFLLSLLAIGTILRWPVRVVVGIIAVTVISGIALQSLRSVVGVVVLLALFGLPEFILVIVGDINNRYVFPRRVVDSDRTALAAFEGTSASFGVFLRPFEFDGCYFVNVPASSPFQLISSMTIDVEALLSIITETLRVPLVALGGTRHHDFRSGRGGRTTARDDEWKGIVINALERSKALFIIPAPNTGTLWELELIASLPNLLSKTMFIMPPRPRRRPFIARHRQKEYADFAGGFETRWAEAQTLALHFGILLPSYTQEGAIFIFANLRESPRVLSTLLPLTDRGTNRIIEYLSNKADPEFA